MSVSVSLTLLTNLMYPELVHSQDSVSRQEYQQDMFSPQMHLVMPLGKQHQVQDGLFLVMDEPIQQHNSSELQITKISYSEPTIQRNYELQILEILYEFDIPIRSLDPIR